MSYKKTKLEFFYIRKSFLEYRQGFKYLKNKFFLASKILKNQKVFEKPINNNNLSIHLLVGHSHLIMCLWSLLGFYQNIENIGQFYLHNDGSLTEKDKNIFYNFFPSIKILDSENFLKQNRDKLKEYPIIEKYRSDYPQYFFLKKIIDPYFVSDKKYHLIIDSDLAWFNKAKEIDQEIQNNCNNSLMMENNRPCYVYFENGVKLDDALAGYNSGIVLYRKENFDLNRLETYFKDIDDKRQNNKHFIEQAGYASCLRNLKKLPENYTIAGDLEKNLVMKHYTSPRRPLFYIEALEKLRDYFLK